jgi:hypothetical protein
VSCCPAWVIVWMALRVSAPGRGGLRYGVRFAGVRGLVRRRRRREAKVDSDDEETKASRFPRLASSLSRPNLMSTGARAYVRMVAGRVQDGDRKERTWPDNRKKSYHAGPSSESDGPFLRVRVASYPSLSTSAWVLRCGPVWSSGVSPCGLPV